MSTFCNSALLLLTYCQQFHRRRPGAAVGFDRGIGLHDISRPDGFIALIKSTACRCQVGDEPGRQNSLGQGNKVPRCASAFPALVPIRPGHALLRVFSLPFRSTWTIFFNEAQKPVLLYQFTGTSSARFRIIAMKKDGFSIGFQIEPV
jgi:hypothetical protein